MTPLEALQQTLAGEHAAVYVYRALAGRVSASAQPELADRLATAYTTHRGRRDQLMAMVRAMDAEPAAAELSYELPNPSRTTVQLRAGALLTEQRCADVYASMVGGTSRGERQWAIDALGDAAVRLLGFGGTPEDFPGVDEL
jgi:rubrerythrin